MMPPMRKCGDKFKRGGIRRSIRKPESSATRAPNSALLRSRGSRNGALTERYVPFQIMVSLQRAQWHACIACRVSVRGRANEVGANESAEEVPKAEEVASRQMDQAFRLP
jgi:hypothetical protein